MSVVGIDVGAETKGFHAVVLRRGTFEIKASTKPAEIVKWCKEKRVRVVAVDAPRGWSTSGKSRAAERDLKIGGKRIPCFATPTRINASTNESGFYDWVFNGERLYKLMTEHFPLFDGIDRNEPICFETFPRAILCAFAGKVAPTKAKVRQRRNALSEQGYNEKLLPNIDFVDAALCAVAADAFRQGPATSADLSLSPALLVLRYALLISVLE